MKKILMLSIVFLFFVVSINATQGIRDDDSYSIKFAWSQGVPTPGFPGGFLYQNDGYLTLTAARTSAAFNVYAKNNSPDAETGASIENHSAWPAWYANPAQGNGWDTPDASPSYQCLAGPYLCNAPFYLLTIDTYQGKWWLFYTQYPNQRSVGLNKGVASVYVPMSGKINYVEFNGDGTIDIEIEDAGGDWKTLWSWGPEIVKLQDGHFLVHIDPSTSTGYMAPKQLVPKDK